MKNRINLKSTAVPLAVENIDTDQIIPARFLKVTNREGFGDNLFRDWRYHKDGTLQKDFVLNSNIYKGSILVAANNFGCGSSREHAAWALKDYGFEVVISSFFADIFKGNALNNAIIPVKVTPQILEIIFKRIKENPQINIEVNLEAQTIGFESEEVLANFEIDPYKKMCIQNNYDDIDYLVSIKKKIEEYELNKINL